MYISVKCNAILTIDELFQVVFGEVLDGMDTVKKIEALGSQSGRPMKKITIAESGELKTDETPK